MSTITQKLKIAGMHCSSCAMNIDFDLEDLDGVNEVKTSFAKQETNVVFDPEILGIPEIIEQIAKTGYTASINKD